MDTLSVMLLMTTGIYVEVVFADLLSASAQIAVALGVLGLSVMQMRALCAEVDQC